MHPRSPLLGILHTRLHKASARPCRLSGEVAPHFRPNPASGLCTQEIGEMKPLRCLPGIVLLVGLVATGTSATTITWTGSGATGSWHTAGNWDLNRVPAAGDDVFIPDVAGTTSITFSSGSTTVHSLTCSEAFVLSGGTLSLDEASTMNTGCAFGGGTLGGTGTLTLHGASTWSGGTMTGSGTTVVATDGSLAITGTAYLYRNLTNDGTLTWTGGNVYGGSGTTLTNNGQLTVDSGSNLTWCSYSGNHTLTNTGTFTKLGTGQATFAYYGSYLQSFNNNGAVSVEAGILYLQCNGSGSNGTFDVAEGKTLYLSGTHALANTTLDGAGPLTVYGGTATFTGTLDGTGRMAIVGGTANFEDEGQKELAGGLTLSGGTLGGTGTLTLHGTSTWSGGTMTGSGTTVVATGASLAVTGTATGTVYLYRNLTNDGTLSWTGGNVHGGSGTTLTNNGQLTVDSGSDLTWNSYSGNHAVTNTGTFIKRGAGQATFAHYGSYLQSFNNNGTVAVEAGILYLQCTFPNFAGSALTGGTYTIKGKFFFPNANIVTNAATIVLDGAASQILDQSGQDGLRGFAINSDAGSFTVTNSRNFTRTGGFANAGTIRAGTNSTFTTTGQYTQSAGITELDGGILAATTLAAIQGGELRGNGTVNAIVQSSGVVSPGLLSPGKVDMSATYTQDTTGGFAIEIGGTTPGSGYDRLNVTGAAALAGSATVTLFNGYDPPAGSSYDIVTAGSITGTFAPLNLPPLLNEKCWHVDYNADSVRLTVYSPPVITQQPVGGEICLNATVVLSVAATGIPAPTYKWRKDGSELQGETGSTFTITSFNAAHNGDYDVVLTNECRTVISDTATLFLDRTPPTMNQCPGDQGLSANASCLAAIPNLIPAVVAVDVCDPNPVVTQSPEAGTLVGLGDTLVTLTATDNAGNSATCTATIMVRDTTPPLITLNGPGEITLECNPATVYVEQGATAADNCDGTFSATVGGDVVKPSQCGDYVVTYSAVDAAGNSAITISRTIHLVDTIPPIINNLPANLTVECQGPSGVPTTDPAVAAFLNMPTASDACDPNVPVTHDAPTTFPLGGTLVTWIAQDEKGHLVTASRTVTVVDTTPPTITCPSPPAPVSANGNCQATLPDLASAASASDVCIGTAAVAQNPAAGTAIGLGNTFVTLTATDGVGNQSTCQVAVTVVDTAPPTITCPPTPAPINANTNCQAAIPDLTAGATPSDNCSVNVTQNPVPGTLVGLGHTLVTLTATDGAGLTATCQVTVTVIDVTPPTITCGAPPAPLNVNTDCKAAVPDLTGSVVASDNCSVTLTQVPPPGTLVGLGDAIVTVTATDSAGLTADCQITVTVVDNTPPTMTCPSPPAPLAADGNCQALLPNLLPLAQFADNCSVSATQSPEAGTVIGLGDTVVTLTATDGAGRTATCQVTVTVQDEDADGDGVPDCADACPNTVPGSLVDAAGCPPVILGDFDRDGDVDPTDFGVFRPCASGPAIPFPAGCEAEDLDGDSDVDQTDFGVFQRCYSGSDHPADPSCVVHTAHISDTRRSECMPGNPLLRDGYPWCGKDELNVTIHSPSLQVTHRNAAYNCCLDDILVTLDVQGSFLHFQEKERLTTGCHCLCCYDTTTTVEGLTPGVYRFEYCWVDEEHGSMCLTEDVTVPLP